MVKIKTIVILELIFFIIVVPLAYFLIGPEKLAQYLIVVYFVSIILSLIVLVLLAIFSKEISWDIEPKENNIKILELEMNQFLTIGITLFGFGLAAIFSALSLENIFIKNILYIISLACVAFGLFVFISRFMPWRRRLLIKYINDEELNKK